MSHWAFAGCTLPAGTREKLAPAPVRETLPTSPAAGGFDSQEAILKETAMG